VGFFGIEVTKDAQQVGGKAMKIERAFIVVGIAVAARVPGGRGEPAREELDLRVPGAAAAADAVQEKDQRSLARDREREARRCADENRFQAYSALAPEILTARPRLSKSFLM
jgi:hypothetical protein